MTDNAAGPKIYALADFFTLISMSFSSGLFLALAISYFAKGGDPLAWIDAGVAIFMLITALFMARRIWNRIPGERQ